MYTCIQSCVRRCAIPSLHAPSTAELLAQSICASITAGEFKPGDPLPQESLAARYGVSRSPLREALRLLEAQGVIVYHSNRGAIVATFNYEELAEVVEIHCVIEQALMSRAIPNMTPHDVERARARLRQMEQTVDHREWLAQHYTFHIELYEPASRPKMRAILSQHVLPVSQLADGEIRVKALRGILNAADLRIVDACEAGNTDAAVSALADHYAPLARLLTQPVAHEQ